MKRVYIRILLLLMAVLLPLTLIACRPDLNYIIGHKPSFRGNVEQVAQDYITVRLTVSDDSRLATHSHVQIPMPPTYSDGDPGRLQLGDEVMVYYESLILGGEDDPVDVETVYAVFLITPAGREVDVSRLF